MSEKTDKNSKTASTQPAQEKAPEAGRQIANLEKRIGQLEKRLANNERFARTFANSLSTQVVAIDAVTDVVRRSLQNDAKVQHELSTAICIYDKHKVRRWFSGTLSVLLWIISIMAAAFVGAAIHWLFAAQ